MITLKKKSKLKINMEKETQPEELSKKEVEQLDKIIERLLSVKE